MTTNHPKHEERIRHTYAAPRLAQHGDVRDVTLGATGTVPESGMLNMPNPFDADLGFTPDPSNNDAYTATP